MCLHLTVQIINKIRNKEYFYKNLQNNIELKKGRIKCSFLPQTVSFVIGAHMFKTVQYIIRTVIEVQTKRSYRPTRRNAIRQQRNQEDRPPFILFLTPLTYILYDLGGREVVHLTLAVQHFVLLEAF